MKKLMAGADSAEGTKEADEAAEVLGSLTVTAEEPKNDA